jgi:hypothetical protein
MALTNPRFGVVYLSRWKRGSSNQGVCSRTFGTANWTQFCPGTIFGNENYGRHEIEFFCGLKCTPELGSLTSTYRVVRKYNFKS